MQAVGRQAREASRVIAAADTSLKNKALLAIADALNNDRDNLLAANTVDMENGIYFRTQNRGQQLVLGSVLEADEREVVTDPDQFDRFVDEAFQLRKLHALHHRMLTVS